MKRALNTTGFLICGLFVFLGGEAAKAQELCDSCYMTAQLTCDTRCQKAKTDKGREKCFKDCFIQICKFSCGYASGTKPSAEEEEENRDKEPESGFSDYDISCDYCVRRQRASGCTRECKASADISGCKNRCAKRKCESKCGLPTRPHPASQQPGGAGSVAQQCAACEAAADGPCRSECKGKNKRNFACEVGCVKERCLEVCNQ